MRKMPSAAVLVKHIKDIPGELLSLVQQILDTLGLCPATLDPKLVLQEACKGKILWTCPSLLNLQKEFNDWVRESIGFEVRIPRYLAVNKDSEFHVFVDVAKDHTELVYL
ncbi:unnamed protein product [Larinioides sclopetarius]|uniref:Uncharacterized protein n=1 Tax=Larinioides sclopetarius TaxID=280406 RepID=A0AAV1ZAM2_9ARAC